MDKKEAKKRIEKLKKVINHHRYLYHVLDKPQFPDAAFDTLKNELEELERKFPDLITLDSPTQRVGGKPLDKFKKFKHPKMMLSFNDAFGEKELDEWEERIKKLIPNRTIDGYYCELKLDGLAIELVYQNGIFKIGSTRGDGKVGEDVTQNLKTISALPLILLEPKQIIKNLEKIGEKELASLLKKNFPKQLVVRGEVFINKKEFERINKDQEKKGERAYANPRNLAAGSIRQLDSKITASRHLDSFVYALITDLGQTPEGKYSPIYGASTHEQEHKILKAFGFKINPHNQFKKDLRGVKNFQSFWEKEREKLAYEIDGIVVIVNSNSLFSQLGTVGKAPRGAIAYKFSPRQATTKIQDIIVQVGRTGALTPVAILKPVQVAGVTISRATLHNEDEIKRLGVKILDTVIVGRAGDVIPNVTKVLKDLRTGKEKEFQMPRTCPVCGSKTLRPVGEAVRRCPNPKCSARQSQQFHHFVSKQAFNIEGLGPKIIDQLLEQGLVQDPADLYDLKEGDLVPLERFADKSAENLVKAIEGSKKISLPRFIYALGIRNVGQETAIDLAGHFGSLENLSKVTSEELETVKDVGPISAKSIYQWFQNKKNIEFLEKFKKAGLEITGRERVKEQSFKNKIFVLTGSLETMNRDEAKEKIREKGGDISESVSGNTDYVVAGTEPGSKYEKAKALGVNIIMEKEFIKLIK